MDTQKIIAEIEALLPALGNIATAINPAVGTTVVAAEQVIPVVVRLVQTGQQILAAKAGVDPALWDKIVAENVAADARFAASPRPTT